MNPNRVLSFSGVVHDAIADSRAASETLRSPTSSEVFDRLKGSSVSTNFTQGHFLVGLSEEGAS